MMTDTNTKTISQIVADYNDRHRIGRGFNRFSVQNVVTVAYKGAEPSVVENRREKVLPLLKTFYLSRVRQRCGTYQPIGDDTFAKIADILLNPATCIGILFNGWTGTGKTTMAMAIMDTISALYAEELAHKEIARQRLGILSFTAESVKASELGVLAKTEPQKFEAVKKATILFIDDIGFNGECDVVNDFGTKRRPFEEILEHRYDNQLFTIATSNLQIDLTEKQKELGDTADTFRSRYGERIYSRVREMFRTIRIGEHDFRTENKQNKK